MARSYYETHKDVYKQYAQLYRETPEGKAADRRHRHKRRSATKSTVCDLTHAQWDTILTEQNNSCAHCRREFNSKLKPTQDHIVPLSKGGSYTYENIQALCQSCNSRKGDRFECDLPYLKKHTSITTTVVTTQVTNWESEEQP